MEWLDEEHTEKVWKAINGKASSSSTLANDLLDHACCFIEEQMRQGVDFANSLQNAMEHILPNGLEEIEQELALMMTIKPNKKMKQLFYISTFISVFSLIFSLLARHWNWHAGTIISTLVGNLCLLFFVFPLVIALAIKNRMILNKTDIFRVVLGVSSGTLITTGMIFKFLYFPMANYMFNIGMLILLFFFLPLFFYQLYARSY
ncbi:hypothetical protein QWY31_02975 [Cytophagales bacterium LB-30]|uniref:DUF1129 family protein n=1 Tax=Shiella aurantiaca TaxID=3058365 RepID=A0ABT8F1X1_9BACT|nr:hypothetical protein [Shiella aurantiaca]MDN4164445.1 hypothetical protein [Shiella aurantiaca]